MEHHNFMAQTDQVDLLNTFTSIDHSRKMLQNLMQALNNTNSAAVAILALEGLFRIEADVNGYQFAGDMFEHIREYLRKWRCDSPLDQAYSGAFKRVVPFLRSLSIFKTLEVPLFIDDYGEKKLLNAFSLTECIPIDLNTPIVHVTHSHEAQQIFNAEEFQPSDNKNIIGGMWFSPAYQLGNPPSSFYGSVACVTTLAELGVSGLRQGEIVSYKKEVNVILYASDTIPQKPLLKPTDDAVRVLKRDHWAYVHVSIFVPAKFLPPKGDAFKSVVRGPYFIHHDPFCVKALRCFTNCSELNGSTQMVLSPTSLSWPTQWTIPGTALGIVPGTTQSVAPCPPQGMAPSLPQEMAPFPPQEMAPCPPQGTALCPTQGMGPFPPQGTIPRTAPRIVPGTTEWV